MKRILQVVGKLDRGGAETWLVQVLRHIDRKQFHMDFLVHTNDGGAYDEEVRALGAKIWPCVSPSMPVQYAQRFRETLRRNGPYDAIHTHVHHFSGYPLMLAALSGVPRRIAHSHIDTRSVERQSGAARKTYVILMRLLTRQFATHGLAVSVEAGDDLFPNNWKMSHRWKLHHLGIDLTRFDIDADTKSVRQGLGIPEGAFVVGHSGRFMEQKNHSFFVDIARALVRRDPRFVFLLIGDGPLRAGIQTKVREHSLGKHFIFTGVRADVPRLMKGAMDLFLFPSLYEGLPLTLLEAQAAGLTCVISDSISPESDVIASLIVRESLTKSADEWAQRLIENQGAARLDFSYTSHCLRERSIEASIDFLASTYSGPKQVAPNHV
jgi:glycosyltransferase involved in cell wall biosynthesis